MDEEEIGWFNSETGQWDKAEPSLPGFAVAHHPPTYEELVAMPTLAVGQADDLKVDDGVIRVWVSRVGRADGAVSDRQVTIEGFDAVSGRWVQIGEYEG